MRKLHDGYIIAEQACANNAPDVAIRPRRDRLLQQMAALTLGSQSMGVPCLNLAPHTYYFNLLHIVVTCATCFLMSFTFLQIKVAQSILIARSHPSGDEAGSRTGDAGKGPGWNPSIFGPPPPHYNTIHTSFDDKVHRADDGPEMAVPSSDRAVVHLPRPSAARGRGLRQTPQGGQRAAITALCSVHRI